MKPSTWNSTTKPISGRSFKTHQIAVLFSWMSCNTNVVWYNISYTVMYIILPQVPHSGTKVLSCTWASVEMMTIVFSQVSRIFSWCQPLFTTQHSGVRILQTAHCGKYTQLFVSCVNCFFGFFRGFEFNWSALLKYNFGEHQLPKKMWRHQMSSSVTVPFLFKIHFEQNLSSW